MREWLLRNQITMKTKLWQTEKMVIFRDIDGKLWRYMPDYHTGWPVEVKNEN